MYTECFYKSYPYMTPREDYDILRLSTTRRKGTSADSTRGSTSRWKGTSRISDRGSRKAILANVRAALNTVVGITGRKPGPGRDIVHTRPIPNSKYSVRLWPGNPNVSEYHMDIVDTATNEAVDTATNEAVDSPFKFELWAIPDPDAPWLGMPSGRLNLLERNFHIPQHGILPGEEKWVLRDGQTCLLKPTGEMDVVFRVPVRNNPKPAKYEYDLVEFPNVV